MKLTNRSVYLLTMLVIAVLTCTMATIFYLGGDNSMAKEAMGGGTTIGVLVFFLFPMMLEGIDE